MKLFSHLIKAIFKPLLGFAKFFITIYGVFLKFFLQLNGGYWGKIGIGQYSKIERKRFFYILPLYILIAILCALLSLIYRYSTLYTNWESKICVYITFLYSFSFIVWTSFSNLLVFCCIINPFLDRKISNRYCSME